MDRRAVVLGKVAVKRDEKAIALRVVNLSVVQKVIVQNTVAVDLRRMVSQRMVRAVAANKIAQIDPALVVRRPIRMLIGALRNSNASSISCRMSFAN
ncbi:hypothetical protein NA78x_001648 [Anatilimnocola sp. NA78]|uniref:hypothetical protein n=1 Tax=Anatilimnocola sp. NA78 TaxID=3415683 RepID=UPI003CE4D4F8